MRKQPRSRLTVRTTWPFSLPCRELVEPRLPFCLPKPQGLSAGEIMEPSERCQVWRRSRSAAANLMSYRCATPHISDYELQYSTGHDPLSRTISRSMIGMLRYANVDTHMVGPSAVSPIGYLALH